MSSRNYHYAPGKPQGRRTSPTSSAPAAVEGGRVRELVEWAVRSRWNTLRYGWARVDAHAARAAMDRLKHWLDTHPYVSLASAREFWSRYAADIGLVMPGNKAGQDRLKEIQAIISAS